MTDHNKVKFYKNPERKKPEPFQPYTPQYKALGLEPTGLPNATPQKHHTGSINQPLLSTASGHDNPRLPRSVMRQPYAEAVPSPIGGGRGQLPNVGNNVEQIWSSVDGEIIDDLSEIPQRATIIDNNDYVSAAALGITEDGDSLVIDEHHSNHHVSEGTNHNMIQEEELLSVIGDVSDGDYILLVAGEAICSGQLEDIQEQVRTLVFGDHILCQGTPTPLEHIVVIKKVAIKIGVFLSE